MLQHHFDHLQRTLHSYRHSIIEGKRKEYIVGNKDVLANFKKSAEFCGLTPLQAIGVLFYKHVASVFTFIKDQKTHSNESFPSRIADSINYLELILALAFELREEPQSADDKGIFSAIEKFVGNALPSGILKLPQDVDKEELRKAFESMGGFMTTQSTPFMHTPPRMPTMMSGIEPPFDESFKRKAKVITQEEYDSGKGIKGERIGTVGPEYIAGMDPADPNGKIHTYKRTPTGQYETVRQGTPGPYSGTSYQSVENSTIPGTLQSDWNESTQKGLPTEEQLSHSQRVRKEKYEVAPLREGVVVELIGLVYCNHDGSIFSRAKVTYPSGKWKEVTVQLSNLEGIVKINGLLGVESFVFVKEGKRTPGSSSLTREEFDGKDNTKMVYGTHSVLVDYLTGTLGMTAFNTGEDQLLEVNQDQGIGSRRVSTGILQLSQDVEKGPRGIEFVRFKIDFNPLDGSNSVTMFEVAVPRTPFRFKSAAEDTQLFASVVSEDVYRVYSVEGRRVLQMKTVAKGRDGLTLTNWVTLPFTGKVDAYVIEGQPTPRTFILERGKILGEESLQRRTKFSKAGDMVSANKSLNEEDAVMYLGPDASSGYHVGPNRLGKLEGNLRGLLQRMRYDPDHRHFIIRMEGDQVVEFRPVVQHTAPTMEVLNARQKFGIESVKQFSDLKINSDGKLYVEVQVKFNVPDLYARCVIELDANGFFEFRTSWTPHIHKTEFKNGVANHIPKAKPTPAGLGDFLKAVEPPSEEELLNELKEALDKGEVDFLRLQMPEKPRKSFELLVYSVKGYGPVFLDEKTGCVKRGVLIQLTNGRVEEGFVTIGHINSLGIVAEANSEWMQASGWTPRNPCVTDEPKESNPHDHSTMD